MVLQIPAVIYFKLAVGRYHTAIGLLQHAFTIALVSNTTGRPFLFHSRTAENSAGSILWVRRRRVDPSGHLGLHYVAEVGNGRASRSPITEEPVQNCG